MIIIMIITMIVKIVMEANDYNGNDSKLLRNHLGHDPPIYD